MTQQFDAIDRRASAYQIWVIRIDAAHNRQLLTYGGSTTCSRSGRRCIDRNARIHVALDGQNGFHRR